MNELGNGWKIILASAIGVGCGLSAFPYYTIGVFVQPLEASMGWSRGDIMLAVGFMLLGTLIAVPIVGAFVDKWGPRKVALLSIPVFGACLAAIGLLSTSKLSFHLAWFLMALLASGTLPIVWTKAINNWFDEKRGIALGLALAGTGIAAALLPSYTTWLISEFGWRAAYAVLGATAVIIAFPVIFLLFQNAPPTSTEAHETKDLTTGLSAGRAFLSWRFWVMSIGLTCISLGVSGVLSNMVPLLSDIGYSPAHAAALAGLIGVSVICGRVIGGFLIDLFWAPAVAFAILSLPAISCLIFISFGPSWWIPAAVILVGLAAGAEFDVIAYFVSRYFGLKHYSKIYSGQYVFFAGASGTAPFIFGSTYDRMGSYDQILLVAAVLFLVGSAMFLTLGKYPDFDPEPESKPA